MKKAPVLLIAVMLFPMAGRATEACSWSMYGHDTAHTFQQSAGCSAVTTANVRTLVPKWFARTLDSVTASPAVANGRVYVGSWSGAFYSLDAETGETKCVYQIDDHHRVAFGRIVSSATVADFPAINGTPVSVVLFGGGATLYALEAKSCSVMAKLDVDPRTEALKEQQASDPPQVEIESSPVVADVPIGNVGVRRTIFVGMDVHNGAGVGRTGVIALTLSHTFFGWKLEPVWKFDPETRQTYTGPDLLTEGSGEGFGCGGVWSSPAVDTQRRVVAFGTSNCEHPSEARAAGETWSEAMWAVDAVTGALRWYVQPAAAQPTIAQQDAEARLDDDFGASPNLFTVRAADGAATFAVGEGRKSAHYYARDADGDELWTTEAGVPGHVMDDFALGGFIGSTAVETAEDGAARRIVGATAFPVVRPDEGVDPDRVDRATWVVRALDAATGEVEWTYRLGGPAYGATTLANGVAFVPDTFTSSIIALDAATGLPLWAAPVPGAPSSSVVPVGDSIYAGVGTRETDAEFKAFGDDLQQFFAGTIGPHPLAPLSGIVAFRLAD